MQSHRVNPHSVFKSLLFERWKWRVLILGVSLVAASSQVMICGNPEMVKDTRHVLEARGLKKNRRSDPGQITVEAYW